MVKVVKLHISQHYNCKSFIDLPQVDISRGHPNHKLVQSKLGGNGEVDGVSGAISIAHNLSQGGATHLSRLVCSHQNRSRRSIGQCRGVSSSDSSSFPLEHSCQFANLSKFTFLNSSSSVTITEGL